MREWAGAAQKFLGPWTERSDFEGALVSGSYAVGLPDTHSDIDIMIVLSDRVRFWERGNRDIDGFLIEYLADPGYFWERTFNDEYTAGRKISINMFAIGKILMDKNGRVEALKRSAEALMQKSVQPMEKRELEMAKYFISTGHDELTALAPQGFRTYAPLYYSHLTTILASYAKFTGVTLPAPAKMQRFLNDPEFRRRYKLTGFADTEFVSLMNSCFAQPESLERITKLATYVLKQFGGFAIKGWSLRTEIKT